MGRALTLNDRLRAEELKKQIRKLEAEQRTIAARFARVVTSEVLLIVE